MRVAVTGGTGCLGTPLVMYLDQKKVETNVLVLPGDSSSHLAAMGVHVVEGDLGCSKATDQLTRDCDCVFHLAGKVHTAPANREEAQEFRCVNVEGTRNLIRSADRNGVRRLVLYSTVGVYGKDGFFHGNEDSPCDPKTAYARSKLEAEKLVLNTHRDGGPEGVVLRFPVVYGPLDRGNIVGLIRAVRKRQFFYFGDGNALRSMVSARNTAGAALKASLEPRAANEVFCVTDGQDYSVRQLVEAISSALGLYRVPPCIPLPVAKVLGRVGDTLERLTRRQFPIISDRVRKLSEPLTFSCEKARSMLGYEPAETLEEGIRREVEWLRETEGWK